MFIKRQIPTLLFLISAVFMGCGKQKTSSLQTFWALNQNDDIIVAKGINQDAISIFRCPTAKNPHLLGDAVDLGALDSCADKVMIYENLSYQVLKDTLLGISPFLIHEMTDATQAELFSQYFNEREGVYERQWLEKKRNELKQSADAMNALMVRKKAIGKKVAPGDEVKLEKTRSGLLDAEKELEALDGIEKQIELLVHEFWDLIQEQSIFQTRLTSLYESIVFLGLDETKVPKHNLFNLWFRDISASSDDRTLNKILEHKNRTKEDGTIINREGPEFGSEFLKSFGESMLLLDWEKNGDWEKKDALLTTVTINESDGSLSYVSKDIGPDCRNVYFFKVYSDFIVVECSDFESKTKDFLIVEIVKVYPLNFVVHRLQGFVSKFPNQTRLSATKIEGEWVFFMSHEKTMEILITSLDRLKTNGNPIWSGTIPDIRISEYYTGIIQKITNPHKGFSFLISASQSYFVPWPIAEGIERKDLFRILSTDLRVKFSEEKFYLSSLTRASGQSNWVVYPRETTQPELPVVQFITGLRESANIPGEFAIETSEYTIANEDLNVRLYKSFYWRGHLIDRTFKGQTMSKITKPYFY